MWRASKGGSISYTECGKSGFVCNLVYYPTKYGPKGHNLGQWVLQA